MRSMLIHQNFTGGNIRILKTDGDVFCLDNELRDTLEDWFYFAFCVEGAAGKTVTFRFPPVRIGPNGPAVSHDLANWNWLGSTGESDAFTYRFGEEENRVYFAHDLLYHPNRFLAFCKEKNLPVQTFCLSEKGSRVPFVTFGDGERVILLTARHHACESTGSYVLEGVLDELLCEPLANAKIVCVPFVDYDGVLAGDQGKSRAPHDHNRDYVNGTEALYPSVREIRRIADRGVTYAFDFHSPWHCGGRNDHVFIVRKQKTFTPAYDRFSSLFASLAGGKALAYDPAFDARPDVEWNASDAPCFGNYMLLYGRARLAFSLETPYFGRPEDVYSQEKAVETGRCFAKALRLFDK